jgi:hypothetical protein
MTLHSPARLARTLRGLTVFSVPAVAAAVLGIAALAPALAATGSPSSPAKTPTFFGAKLSTQSQPSNAQNGQSCDENAGIPSGSWCTWVAITAFENGSHFTAPMTGTVKHVKLVSCVKGKFRLLLAKADPSTSKARIVVKGPEIFYAGQSPCGGSSGDQYVVQSFKVSLKVAKGDYIAIEARRAGTLSCSGGDGFLLFAPPLPVGGPLKKAQSGASCDLLVQLSYK